MSTCDWTLVPALYGPGYRAPYWYSDMFRKPLQPHSSLHNSQDNHDLTMRKIITGINIVDGRAYLMRKRWQKLVPKAHRSKVRWPVRSILGQSATIVDFVRPIRQCQRDSDTNCRNGLYLKVCHPLVS